MNKLLFVSLALLSVGCAHRANHAEEEERPAAPDPARMTKLKALHPGHPGSGVVVLYRNKLFGGIFGVMGFNGSLWVDDQAVGDIRDNSYDVLELGPGRHSVRVLGTAGGMPLQSTTVISVNAGQVSWLALDSVQEFNNAAVRFRPSSAAAIDEIATDCTEGFTLDLSPTQTSKL
jgi:hypothetical protein